jgi:trk system potassium uptake protein TrkA
MYVVIMGSGRVGQRLAKLLVDEGHEVLVIDRERSALDRLGADFNGRQMVGNGIDIDVLRKAELERADVFAAVTPGDNRNIMASQIAKHIFNVPKVVARIFDPIRSETFKALGIEGFSPTVIGADVFFKLITGKDRGETV